MSGTFIFVICIVAIYYTFDTIQKMIKARSERMAAAENPEELAESLQRVDELEERVRVLERIITEDKHDLRREISRL